MYVNVNMYEQIYERSKKEGVLFLKEANKPLVVVVVVVHLLALEYNCKITYI